jgi:hypothetical protein
MPKIVNSASGPIPPDPDQPQPVDGRKEVIVTPEPKTRKQARANKKAERLTRAQERQARGSYAPHKVTGRAKRAARRRKREVYQKTRDADSRT